MKLNRLAPVSFLILLCSSWATLALAETKKAEAAPAKPTQVALASEVSPHQVVETVTAKLMGVVSGGKQALQTDPQKYFADVRAIMESAVDFEYIARNVMGAKYWKEATETQKQRFVEVFTSGLVETYAKGMANFADFEISVVPPAEPIGNERKTEVMQKFKGPNGVNLVSYTMGKQKSGEWKLINVVLDGVNLGKTLRAQFSQSVTESKGDLEAAIGNWRWQG